MKLKVVKMTLSLDVLSSLFKSSTQWISLHLLRSHNMVHGAAPTWAQFSVEERVALVNIIQL